MQPRIITSCLHLQKDLLLRLLPLMQQWNTMTLSKVMYRKMNINLVMFLTSSRKRKQSQLDTLLFSSSNTKKSRKNIKVKLLLFLLILKHIIRMKNNQAIRSGKKIFLDCQLLLPKEALLCLLYQRTLLQINKYTQFPHFLKCTKTQSLYFEKFK